MLVLLSSLAFGMSLSLVSEEQPYEGVTLRRYRTSDPATDVWAASVDLCAASIHLDATKAPDRLQTAPSFGGSVGAQLVVNGDFYATSPVRVYGRAIGNGIDWPLEQTGIDPRYSTQWYYGKAGWIALGHDRVEFGHTGWVRDNLSTSEGWEGAPPPGTLALVGGFPELVSEGLVRTCSDPASTACFPDRTDMKDRHPRTAMALTEDRATLIFVVVDGRSSTSAGMRGAELAELMGQLGAWQYRVETWVEPGWALFDQVRYRVVADGVQTEVEVDPSGREGWIELGTFAFASGGHQFVALYDDADHAVASGQHIVADAIRLVRLDLPEEPGEGDSGDSGGDLDSDAPDSGDPVGPAGPGASRTGCSSRGPSPLGWAGSLPLWIALARRRRHRASAPARG